MKIKDFLASKTTQLTGAGIATARLDCLVLLEDVLNTNRTQILAHQERELTEVELQKLNVMVAKRTQHIPLAYIRGKTEFYGREFAINNRALEPRPESETMLELLKSLLPDGKDLPVSIADIGTGSAALAITAKLEHPAAQVLATDIDPQCLMLAKQNAQALEAEVLFLQGDLLAPLKTEHLQQPTILLCNLPYVPDDFHINTAATHEPKLAIFGGKDGLALFRNLFAQLQHAFPEVMHVLCESLPPQHAELANIAKGAGFMLAEEQDFIQLFSRTVSI